MWTKNKSSILYFSMSFEWERLRLVVSSKCEISSKSSILYSCRILYNLLDVFYNYWKNWILSNSIIYGRIGPFFFYRKKICTGYLDILWHNFFWTFIRCRLFGQPLVTECPMKDLVLWSSSLRQKCMSSSPARESIFFCENLYWSS